jgi:hypothetical protein
MPIRIRRVHILEERKFKTSFVEAVLKFLELIRWSHLGYTKYVWVNLFDDTNQRILFPERLGRKHDSSVLPPIHFEIVLDVIVSEGYRLLSKTILGQQAD